MAAWEPHGRSVLAPNARIMVVEFLPVFLGDEMVERMSWLRALLRPPHSQRPQALGEPARARTMALSQRPPYMELDARAFSGLFRLVTGMSSRQFCLYARMAHVARELALTDRPVDHLAAELGFTDASHLHRHLVKQYGCTPAQYRRRFHL